jgi:hypothetical protein
MWEAQTKIPQSSILYSFQSRYIYNLYRPHLFWTLYALRSLQHVLMANCLRPLMHLHYGTIKRGERRLEDCFHDEYSTSPQLLDSCLCTESFQAKLTIFGTPHIFIQLYLQAFLKATHRRIPPAPSDTKTSALPTWAVADTIPRTRAPRSRRWRKPPSINTTPTRPRPRYTALYSSRIHYQD